MKYKSKIFEAIYESVEGLYKVGCVTDEEFKDFSNRCLMPIKYYAESYTFDYCEPKEFLSDFDAVEYFKNEYGETLITVYKQNEDQSSSRPYTFVYERGQ